MFQSFIKGEIDVKKIWSRMRLMLRVRRFVPFLKEFFLSSEVPVRKKVFSAAIMVGYWMLPFDIVPDFLSFFGLIDDVAIFMLLLQQIVKMAPASMRERYDISA